MTYDYICEKCLHEWEEEQRISDDPIKICPKCNEQSAKRQISAKGGFILVGSGWFKSGGY